MKKLARYRYKTVPVSARVAKSKRRDEVEHLEAQIDDLENQLEELLKTPLPTTRQKQIAVYPGEKGYDNLPISINAGDWQGEVRWKNIPV